MTTPRWLVVVPILLAVGCTLSFDAPVDASRDARSGGRDGAIDAPAPPPDSGADASPPPDSGPDESPDASPPPDSGADARPPGDAGACDPARCPHAACTIAFCAGTSCAERPAGSGASCDDGDPCTRGDACDASGRCLPGAACVDDGNPCTAEGCGPSGCTSSAVPDDTTCAIAPGIDGRCCAGGCVATLSDPAHCGACGRSCDASSSCMGGACRSCVSNADCETSTADCVRRATCEAGRCRYTPDIGSCYIDGRCWDVGDRNPANPCEQCTGRGTTWTARPICEDGLYCTVEDPCEGAVCLGGMPRSCEDLNPCTADSCNEALDRCDHTPVGDGTDCDDGNPCTTGDRCATGSCTPIDSVSCVGPALPCHVYACDPSTGACDDLPDLGASCDDGDCCTTSDSCTSVGGSVACRGTPTAAEPCRSPACVTTGGGPTCSQQPVVEGTACSSGTCGSGTCDATGTCVCPP